MKNFMQGRLTFTYWTKGEEMSPTISDGGTLLVRKLPAPTPTYFDSLSHFPFLFVLSFDKGTANFVSEMCGFNPCLISLSFPIGFLTC